MTDDDLTPILEVVKNYYDGMVRGQADTLARIFDVAAQFQGFRDGQEIRRGLDAFITMACTPGSSGAGVEDYMVRIDLIDRTGPLAVVKVIDRFRGRTYTDYLMLINAGGAWRIVNKAFLAWD